MRTLLSTLARPEKFAAEISATPQWAAAFLILSLMEVVISFLMHGQAVQGVVAHLPAGMSEADRVSVKTMLDEQRVLAALFKPFRLALECVFVAVLMHGVSLFFFLPRRPRYAHFFSLVVHAEAVLVLSQAVILIRNFIPGVQGSFDPPLSAGALLSKPAFVLAYLVNSFSLFHLWFLALLVAGVAQITRLRIGKAIAVTVTAWLLAVGAKSLILYSLIEFFHFPL